MKRRSFLSAIGATAAMPAIPKIPFATPAPAAVASYNHHMFGHTLSVIRTKGTLSLSELARITKLTPSQSNAIVSELTKKGFVSSNASTTGILTATRPTWMTTAHSPASKIVSKIMKDKPANITEKVSERARKLTIDETSEGLEEESPLETQENEGIEPLN